MVLGGAWARTVPRELSKRLKVPQLSPTHTRVKIIRWLSPDGSSVVSYDPVLLVECSPDLVTEAFRDYKSQTIVMMVDTQDEGDLRIHRNFGGNSTNEWLDVGTELGIIDDGEPIDGDWLWQAYKDEE